jgi:zinc protease
MDYYRIYYQPNNAVLVIVGDFDTDEVLSRVRELFGPIPPGPQPPPVTTPEPPQEGERRVMIKGVSGAAYFMALYHIPEAKPQRFVSSERARFGVDRGRQFTAAQSGGRQARLMTRLQN